MISKDTHLVFAISNSTLFVVVSGEGPPKRGGGGRGGGGGGPHGINLEAEETGAIHDVKKRAAEDAEDARLNRD